MLEMPPDPAYQEDAGHTERKADVLETVEAPVEAGHCKDRGLQEARKHTSQVQPTTSSAISSTRGSGKDDFGPSEKLPEQLAGPNKGDGGQCFRISDMGSTGKNVFQTVPCKGIAELCATTHQP